jgi:hypothetical protein
MSAPADGNSTTVVIEREPGLVYVKVADPKPGRPWTEFLLRKTIDHWFGARPQFAIDRAEAVVQSDVMQGIHVWYHVIDQQVQPTIPRGPEPATSPAIEIHGAIAHQFAQEYVEAVIGEAMRISLEFKDPQETLIVVNPRRIAVILDKPANRGAVIPLESIDQFIKGSAKTRFQAWLAGPASRFYVMQIAGSWFAGR